MFQHAYCLCIRVIGMQDTFNRYGVRMNIVR